MSFLLEPPDLLEEYDGGKMFVQRVLSDAQMEIVSGTLIGPTMKRSHFLAETTVQICLSVSITQL